MAKVPYEFLARWNHLTGTLQGAHVKVFDNVAMKEGDAQPVAVAGAAGFPLADILTALQTGAISSMDSANAALAAEKTAHAATTASLTAEQSAHAATAAQLNAALAALKAAGIKFP